MLERKQKKTLPPREQVIVDGSVKPVEIKEVTHIRSLSSDSGLPEGLYQYNSGNECVTSLDDEMIGRYPAGVVAKVIANSLNNIQVFRHLPTWKIMIDKGEVVDNREKKEEEIKEEEKIMNKVNPPVRRKLSM